MPKEIRNKRIIWILVLSLFIMAAGITADAFWFASSRFRVHYETLSSNTIPQNMDGMSIAAFGDLEYGTFMNEERLSRVVRKLNELSPDTIIFLGDLYDTGYLPDEASLSFALTIRKWCYKEDGIFQESTFFSCDGLRL